MAALGAASHRASCLVVFFHTWFWPQDIIISPSSFLALVFFFFGIKYLRHKNCLEYNVMKTRVSTTHMTQSNTGPTHTKFHLLPHARFTLLYILPLPVFIPLQQMHESLDMIKCSFAYFQTGSFGSLFF